MTSEQDRHWESAITRRELIEALDQVPPGVRLVKNDLGNLAGYDSDRNYVGWLDLSKPPRWNPIDPGETDG